MDTKSIRFHMERGDIERWLRQVVGDDKLADIIASISEKKLTGEKLRKRVLNTTKRRIKKLQEASKPNGQTRKRTQG